MMAKLASVGNNVFLEARPWEAGHGVPRTPFLAGDPRFEVLAPLFLSRSLPLWLRASLPCRLVLVSAAHGEIQWRLQLVPPWLSVSGRVLTTSYGCLSHFPVSQGVEGVAGSSPCLPDTP